MMKWALPRQRKGLVPTSVNRYYRPLLKLFHNQLAFHLVMAQSAEARTLEGKRSRLVSREFHGDRLALWQCLVDVKCLQLDSVFSV